MNKKRKFLFGLGALGLAGFLFAASSGVSLSRVGIWDTATDTFHEDLTTGDPIDTLAASAVAAHDSAMDSGDILYTAFTQADNGVNQIFVTRNTGEAQQVWNQTAGWTTAQSAADPVSRHLNRAASGPSIAIDSNDDIYVSFVQNLASGANAQLWLSKYDASATEFLIWDDGATSLTNNFAAPTAQTDSISNQTSSNNVVSGTPSVAIDSNNDVWLAYTQQGDNGANNKIWLSMFDVSRTDAYIWDEGGAGSLTNNLAAPVDVKDSISNNELNDSNALGSPVALADANGDIWISYVHEGATGANAKVYLSMFDVSRSDAYIWDDGGTSLTNDLTAATDAESISHNVSSDSEASGTPSMAIDSNGDVWIAYTQQGDTAANNKVWLSMFDVSRSDAYIWDEGGSSLSNNLATVTDAGDSISNGANAQFDALGSPDIGIDSSGDVWISYRQEGDTGGNGKMWVSMFDVSRSDAYIWHDSATSLTNNLAAPTDAKDSISINSASGVIAAGDPSLTVDTSTGDVYVAYTQDHASGGVDHIWLSYLDVSSSDVLIWDEGATSFTNNLAAPTAETDAFDQGTAAFVANTPKIYCNNRGIFVSLIQQSTAGGIDHLYLMNLGNDGPAALPPRRSSDGGVCALGNSYTNHWLIVPALFLMGLVGLLVARLRVNK